MLKVTNMFNNVPGWVLWQVKFWLPIVSSSPTTSTAENPEQTEGTQKRPIEAMNDVTIKHSVVSLFCTDPYIHVYCMHTNIHVLLKCKCKR